MVEWKASWRCYELHNAHLPIRNSQVIEGDRMSESLMKFRVECEHLMFEITW